MAKALLLIMVVAVGVQCAQAAAGTGACFTDPTAASCADPTAYYPDADINVDLGKLCNMMSHMPACSIRMACTQATPAVVGDYCKPWSLLSGICSTSHGEMMAGMGGCEKYKQLCVANTVVVGCETQIPKLVTTKEVVDDTFAACADTPKPAQCSTCVAASASLIGSSACANPLPVLSDACQAKSSATYCSNLKDMCNAADAAISNSSLFCAGVTCGASRAHFSALTLLVAAAVALFV